jgi:hypothetical protein
MKKSLLGLALLAFSLSLQGCLAVAAGGAVVGVTGAVVGTGVKATGAVVGAAIPDGDKDKKDKKDKEDD